jgi:hypothetical protein
MNHKYRLFNLFIAVVLVLTTLSFPTSEAQAYAEGPVQLMLDDYAWGNGPRCWQVGNSISDTQNGVAAYRKDFCSYDNSIFQPAANQSFTLEYMGPGASGDLYAIRVKHSNKCLVVANNSTATGAAIVQTTCTVGTYWYIDFKPSQWAQFRAPHSNKCISSEWNGPLIQRECSFSSTVRLVPVGIGVRIKSVHSGKCMDVVNNSGGGMADGTNIQQYDCLGYNQTNQRWNIEIDQYSEVKLRAVHSGKCAKLTGWTNGARVKQYTCSDSSTMEWYTNFVGMSPAGPRFKISMADLGNPDSADNRICIDVDTAGSGAGMQNGAKIQGWDCLGNEQLNQLWIFKQLYP